VRQPDGKLVGTATAASGTGKILLRFAADGGLDCRFGVGGVAATGLGEGIRFMPHFGVVLDDDGRLVTAGAVGPVGARMLAVERREGGDGAPRCGDCTVDPGEACDDGNASATDACKPDCTPNVCGDGAVHAGVEACDDGAGNDGPASCCTADCTPKPDETSCDDGRLCTIDDRCHAGTCDGAPRPCSACEACDPSAGCVATPRQSCRQSLAPRHSSLSLRRGGARPDRLVWRWIRGEATFTPDFGDPTTADTYAFCLYDVSEPAAQLLVRATAPAGGTCGAHPCWRRTRSGRLVYRDRTGAAEGLTGVTLQWGGDGRSFVTVQRSGPSFAPPLSIATPLVAQLQSSTGRCWETRHGGAATRRNDVAGFRALGD
jgi:cysteine-rich repeat protein